MPTYYKMNFFIMPLTNTSLHIREAFRINNKDKKVKFY